MNSEPELRKSIQFFVAKSIEYAMKDEFVRSVAFATPNSSADENILAQELIGEAKRQLESRSLQLTISFILLKEQQSLVNHLLLVASSMQNTFAQLEWKTASKMNCY